MEEDGVKAVVALQGFKDNSNEFIVKEFAVVSQDYKLQMIFSPPYEFDRLSYKMQSVNGWTADHNHMIKWNEGSVVFRPKIIESFLDQFDCILVKGHEKCEYLKKFHENVVPIYENLKPTSHQRVECLLKQHSFYFPNCALQSAVDYANRIFDEPL